MEKVLDIFGIVKGRRRRRRLGSFLLIPRLPGVDPFEDAKPPEIR